MFVCESTPTPTRLFLSQILLFTFKFSCLLLFLHPCPQVSRLHEEDEEHCSLSAPYGQEASGSSSQPRRKASVSPRGRARRVPVAGTQSSFSSKYQGKLTIYYCMGKNCLSCWPIMTVEVMLVKQRMPVLHLDFLILNEHEVIFLVHGPAHPGRYGIQLSHCQKGCFC